MFKLIRIAAASAIAVFALAPFWPANDVAAAGDPAIGMEVLDQLCAASGGTPINSPYAIARCQDARSRQGFATEELICEGLLDGEFVSALSQTRRHRTNWACIATYPV